MTMHKAIPLQQNYILLFLIITLCAYGEILFAKVDAVHAGNLSLLASQQPAPCFGFGQNIVDQGDLLVYNYMDIESGKDQLFVDDTPSLLYGIRDNLSLYFTVPFAVYYKEDRMTLSGLLDMAAQFEYAAYTQTTEHSSFQSTVVGAMSFPTNTVDDIALRGIRKTFSGNFESVAYFIGTTASYLSVDWYAYASMGGVITTEKNGMQQGGQFLYQAGFGHNIAYKTDEWILMWMVEMIGNDSGARKFNGRSLPNTGGNVIMVGPSLWYSTPEVIVQLGVAAIPYQNLNGVQSKSNFYLVLDAGWKF